MDYCFPDGRAQDKSEDISSLMTVLVAKEDVGGGVLSLLVSRKGAANRAVVKTINDWVDQLGYPKVIVKCDNEKSIVQVQKEMQEARTDKITIPENPPKEDSRGNGLAENTVKEVEGYIRTIKNSVEENAGIKIPPKSDLMSWVVRHVGTILSRVKVNHESGLTAYEKCKGKSSTAPLVPFGESVLFQPTVGYKNRSKL